jgi:Wzt-like putative exopolysaccharide export protein/sulfotransferase famil protein
MSLYERKFLFDHLPKTGGTAFRTVLEELFGPENVTPHLEGRSEIWAVQRFAGARLISGHFLSLIPGDNQWFGRIRLTLLRDPIDRAVSEYFYWRHHASEGGVADKLGEWAQKYGIGDFFKAREESDETGAVNFYAKHFASRISRDLGDSKRTLALAMKSLKSYDFIGIYEHLHDSVDMFCWQYGLPPVKAIPHVNVTAQRVRVADLDSRTFDQLVGMNDLDMQLYDFALQIFETRKRRMFRELLERRDRRNGWKFGRSHDDAAPASAAIENEEVGENEAKRDLTQRSRTLRKHESFGTREVEIVAAQVIGSRSGNHEVAPGEPVALSISISAHADVPNLTVGFDVSDAYGEVVFGTNTYQRGAVKSVRKDCDYDIVFRFKANLNRGRYSVGASLHTGANHTDRCFHWRDHATEFDVVQLGEPDFIGYCRLEPTIEWWDHASATSLPEPENGAIVREPSAAD